VHVASRSRLHRGRQMATAFVSGALSQGDTDAIDAPGARVAEREPKGDGRRGNPIYMRSFDVIFI